jgi:hypothetical protein
VSPLHRPYAARSFLSALRSPSPSSPAPPPTHPTPAQYLYTLTVKDSEKADKLKSSLPPGLSRSELPKKGSSRL